MKDLIDRQAAIRWVKTECNPYGKPTLDFESGKKVIEHLEQMPSAQADSKELSFTRNALDTISRQDAIDALAKFVPYAICDESTESYTNGLTDAYNLILQLPSAQPEIIRCKDCKWKQGAECVRFADVRPFADDFCSRAERRTDEE